MKTKGVQMASLVIKTISKLQRNNEKAAIKDIKNYIVHEYGDKACKYLNLVPPTIHKGMNLGLIAKYGDNYRTKMYLARRRRGGGGGRRKRRRRRRRGRRH